MSITDQVKQVLDNEQQNRVKETNFQDLRDFYEQAKKEGIVVTPTYTLPQLDSVGRRLYSTQKTSEPR